MTGVGCGLAGGTFVNLLWLGIGVFGISVVYFFGFEFCLFDFDSFFVGLI